MVDSGRKAVTLCKGHRMDREKEGRRGEGRKEANQRYILKRRLSRTQHGVKQLRSWYQC